MGEREREREIEDEGGRSEQTIATAVSHSPMVRAIVLAAVAGAADVLPAGERHPIGYGARPSVQW